MNKWTCSSNLSCSRVNCKLKSFLAELRKQCQIISVCDSDEEHLEKLLLLLLLQSGIYGEDEGRGLFFIISLVVLLDFLNYVQVSF